MEVTPYRASPFMSMVRHMMNFTNDLEKELASSFHRSALWMDEEMHATDDGYEIEVPVPGMQKEHVSVTLDSRTLKINAERSFKTKKMSVQRTFLLPSDADTASVHATVQDGLLVVTMRRSAPPSHRIEVH